MEKEKENKKEEYTVRIGALLKRLLEKQKERVKRETYGVCKSSDLEAGEIIAKKIIENNIL